jgi:polygalacturonase
MNNARIKVALAGILLSSTLLASAAQAATQTFSVKDFGATGDGTTDDTAAIQAALAAANAVPGSKLVFPSGNYVYSGQLTANGISVVGHSATLTASNPANDFAAMFTLTGSQVSITGFTFASSDIAVGRVVVDAANGFKVENNTFTLSADSVDVRDSSANGKINSNKMTLLGSATSAISLDTSSQISIDNNAITGNATSDNISVSNCDNVAVTRNTIDTASISCGFSNHRRLVSTTMCVPTIASHSLSMTTTI